MNDVLEQLEIKEEQGTRFSLTGSELAIGDPFYCRNAEESAQVWRILNALPGTWEVEIRIHEEQDERDNYVTSISLFANHIAHPHLPLLEKALDKVPVDAGTLGVFDYSQFENRPSLSDDDRKQWFENTVQYFGKARNSAFLPVANDTNASAARYGFITYTAHGDGRYGVFVNRNANNQITSVRIELD